MEIETNKEYKIEISSVSSDGNGVGHINGLTVFIPKTVTGDIIKAVITKVKKHYAYGKMLEIIEPSPWRTAEKCPYCENCGGCQLWHIQYNYQLKIKKDIIENSMRRIGGFSDFSLDNITGMDIPKRYRNKTIFQIGSKQNNSNAKEQIKYNNNNNNSKILCGFYAQSSHNIIPINDCLISNKFNESINKTIINYMKTCKVSAYNERIHKGVIRRIFTRVSFSTGEIMVIISANSKKLFNQEYLINQLRNVTDKITSIILNINTKKNSSLLGEKNIILWGKSTITDTLCGIEFFISPESFFQINPVQTEKLYNRIIEYADINNNNIVMDVYCGIGTISLYAAKYAKKVISIEIVPEAIENAKQNAIHNNILNTEFYADSAENIVPKLLSHGIKPNVIILDPPRKGSDKVTLSAIVKAHPEKIIYVSCNSATLARDSQFLVNSGYIITKSHGFDLFPYTVHAETVILFEK